MIRFDLNANDCETLFRPSVVTNAVENMGRVYARNENPGSRPGRMFRGLCKES